MISRRLQLILAGTVTVLAINGAISYRAVRTLIDSNRWVVHTEQTLDGIRGVLSAMKDAEIGARGYLIAGDTRFLEPYQSGSTQIDTELAHLSELVQDNPVQSVRIPQLKASTSSALVLLREAVRLRVASNLEEVIASGLLDRSKEAMDQVRREIGEMQQDERRLRAVRTTDSRRAARDAVVTFVVANVFLTLLLIFIYRMSVRELRNRAETEAALKAGNERLESRVIERTAALANANIDLAAEISVRKTAEAQLNATGIELARSNRELQDFAFVASHDLQEPLRKVQAFGDRLRVKHGASLNPEGHDYLARMLNAAGRMHVLINDLLTFSRVTNKAGEFVPVNLDDIVRGVTGDLEVAIAQTGAQVDVQPLPMIEADPLQMRQLLQNLIGNALKFHLAGKPPSVWVSAEVTDSECELQVRDNGIGFDEKYLDRIFTPFQRLHGRGEYEGTGIGLAVCRRIVERHGGRITATSTPGSGSTFVVCLPLRQGVAPELAATPDTLTTGEA